MNENDLNAEKAALKLFKRASQKLYDERLDEAYVDLLRVIRGYPDTHMAFKSRFLICILCKTTLYSEVLLTEAFVTGVKTAQKNPIVDLFNKDLKYFVSKYEKHFNKRKKSFENLRESLKELLELEPQRNYPEIHMYVTLSSGRLKGCDPLSELERIREGEVLSERELIRITNDLYYYILVTVLSDDFDIEYSDELSNLIKNKLNRVDFYHSSLNWLHQFYNVQQDLNTGEIMRKCAVIVLGLTDDSTDRRRQEAYEILSKMSKNYYTMVCSREEFEETPYDDIEDRMYAPTISHAKIKTCSLIDLVAMDEASQTFSEVKKMRTVSPMISFEIEIEPPQEVIQAKHEVEVQELKDSVVDSFASKLEFD